MHLPIGTRCYEHDRGGDATPRGGVVIATPAGRVVVATSWGKRTQGRRAGVPFLEVAVLDAATINPDTVEQLGGAERVRLARAVAGVIADRRASTRTEDDDRDLALLAELMLPPLPAGYAAGIAVEDGAAVVLDGLALLASQPDRVVDLMAALEESVAEARRSRSRTKPGGSVAVTHEFLQSVADAQEALR